MSQINIISALSCFIQNRFPLFFHHTESYGIPLEHWILAKSNSISLLLTILADCDQVSKTFVIQMFLKYLEADMGKYAIGASAVRRTKEAVQDQSQI